MQSAAAWRQGLGFFNFSLDCGWVRGAWGSACKNVSLSLSTSCPCSLLAVQRPWPKRAIRCAPSTCDYLTVLPWSRACVAVGHGPRHHFGPRGHLGAVQDTTVRPISVAVSLPCSRHDPDTRRHRREAAPACRPPWCRVSTMTALKEMESP